MSLVEHINGVIVLYLRQQGSSLIIVGYISLNTAAAF